MSDKIHQKKTKKYEESMAIEGRMRVNVEQILLTSIGVGMLNVDTLVAKALATLTGLKKDDRRYHSSYYVENAIVKLEKHHLLDCIKKGKTSSVRLTEKGNQELEKYTIESENLKPQKWDRKWRLVIFDIKEAKKGIRDRIRRNLVRFGFEKLQNSVWVYPYECEDLIALLKADCKIDKEVLYMESNKIQDDGWLKKKFRLSA